MSAKGKGPAHIALSKEHNVIIVSNYSSGGIVAYAIDQVTGEMSEEPLLVDSYERGSGADPERQEAPHAHGAFFHRDNAYVVDLGGDKIWHYGIKQDAGKGVSIERKGHLDLYPGLGPRHLVVDDSRNRKVNVTVSPFPLLLKNTSSTVLKISLVLLTTLAHV